MDIYADNAATTKLSRAAKNAMFPYFDELYGNPSSLHSKGQTVKEALNKARDDVARAIGAKNSSGITFTSGGSESDNQAIISAAEIGAKKGKKHIVSTEFEHHAVLHTLERLEKQGFEITLISPERNGIISVESVKNAVREDTALVTVMYANNEIGTIQPIAEIGAVCREKGVLFHTDAVQATGHLHIDVDAQNIDLLSLSAHKFHGPKGVGVLYAKRGIPLTRLIEGGGQEKGRRAGTENIPGIIGLAAALTDAVSRIDKNTRDVGAIRDRIIDGLLEIPNTILNGDRENRLPGNINVSFEGIEGESLLLLLDDKGITVSSSSACTSSSLLPSHVLLAIGVPREVAHGSLRISLSEYNTLEEADYIISSVKEVVSELRDISPVWDDLGKGVRNHVI
ncbi:MAG: aminotransferase class V-fold PLP-dependent enzyme [Oscillospiraceae bacterium]|nr:aminotransferase class V-fold PLP-dependent enzyme [Oscillospiraceae bacterium]